MSIYIGYSLEEQNEIILKQKWDEIMELLDENTSNNSNVPIFYSLLLVEDLDGEFKPLLHFKELYNAYWQRKHRPD